MALEEAAEDKTAADNDANAKFTRSLGVLQSKMQKTIGASFVSHTHIYMICFLFSLSSCTYISIKHLQSSKRYHDKRLSITFSFISLQGECEERFEKASSEISKIVNSLNDRSADRVYTAIEEEGEDRSIAMGIEMANTVRLQITKVEGVDMSRHPNSELICRITSDLGVISCYFHTNPILIPY